MMKPVLLLLCGALLLASCQKKDAEKKNEETDQSTKIDPANANAVAAAIKVWHGVSQNGNPPVASSANGPVLEAPSSNEDIQAISGRFVFIQPEVTSGNIAGYYFQVKGAGSYFKIDFTKPRNAGRLMQPRTTSLRKALRLSNADSVGGYADSAIVISLPSNLKPGRICGTYWAYDANGNASKPVEICVKVSDLGADASSSYLNGSWHATMYKNEDENDSKPITYPDTTFENAFCNDNYITGGCNSANCYPIEFIAHISTTKKYEYSFSANGAMNFTLVDFDKNLDWNERRCNNLNYYTYYDTLTSPGSWSYNSSTKKLLLIFEYDELGNPTTPEIYEYLLTKVSDTKILFKDPEVDAWLQLEK